MPDQITQAQGTEGTPTESKMTLDQFTEKLDTDKDFRLDYLNNPEKYAEYDEMLNTAQNNPQGSTPAVASQEHSSAHPEATPQGTAQPAAAPAAPSEEFVELTNVKIPKRLLGSYAVNRTPEEAIQEALKGKQAADTYIDRMKGDLSSALNENVSLRTQLLRFQQTGSAPQGQPPVSQPSAPQGSTPAPQGQGAVEEINEEDLDTIDILNPDDTPKLINTIKSLTKELKKVKAESATAVSTAGKLENDRRAQEIESQKTGLRNKSLQREFAEIEELQHEVPELRTSKNFRDVDNDVLMFYQALGKTAGVQNYMDAVNLYKSGTPEGEQFKAKCSQLGIIPPEEWPVHERILSIRNQKINDLQTVKNDLSAKFGRQLEDYEVPVMPNTSYLDYYRKSNPVNVQSVKQQVVLDVAQSVQRASQTQHVPEVPPSSVVPRLTPDNMTAEQMYQFANSKDIKDMTTDECQLLYDIFQMNQIPPPTGLLVKLGKTR